MPDAGAPASRQHARRAEGAVSPPAPLRRTRAVASSLLSLLLPLAALLTVQSVSPVGQQVPTGAARFDLAASWLAAEPGALAGSASWFTSPLLGRLQLGVLLHLVPGRPSVLGAAQVALLLLAAVQTVLLWWLLRRTGRTAAGAGLATAAFAVAPSAVLAHATASSAAVGVVWLLLAAVLLAARSRPAAVGAGAAAAVAVASQPLTLVPVVAGAIGLAAARRAAARRTASEPRPWARGLVIGAAVVVVLVVAAAAVLATLPASTASRALDAVTAAQGPASFGAAAAVTAVRIDPLGVVVAAVALLVVARRAGGRVQAGAAGAIALASVWPAGTDAVAPIAVALPVVAIAVAAVADRAIVALASPVFRRSLVGSGWLTGVAALLLVSVVVSLTGLESLVPAQDRPVARAARWLTGSVPRGQVVLVGLGAWPDLDRAGAAQVGWYAVGSSGSPPSSTPWTRADYVVADAALTSVHGGAASSVLSGSVVVARFGSGAGALAVRAVRGGGSGAPGGTTSPAPFATPSATASTEAERLSAVERARAGRQLSGNARIEMSGKDRALLRSGQVDTRVALVLAQLATVHRVTVSSFGTAPGDTSGVRTTVLISRIDGRPVPADVGTTGELLRFLSALRGDFATRSIDSSQAGVTAGFTPDPTFVPSS